MSNGYMRLEDLFFDGDDFLVTTGRTMLGDVGREVQTDEEGNVSDIQMTSMMDFGCLLFFFSKLILETCIKVDCQTILKMVILSCLVMAVYQQDISPALNSLNACTTVAI
jgi:hypothetical protein